MNIVDSPPWLGFLGHGPNGNALSQAAEAADKPIARTICLRAVLKRVLRQRRESAALAAIAPTRQGRGIPLSERIALPAADSGPQTSLSMADCVILDAARVQVVHIWTHDADTDRLDDVTCIQKEQAWLPTHSGSCSGARGHFGCVFSTDKDSLESICLAQTGVSWLRQRC